MPTISNVQGPTAPPPVPFNEMPSEESIIQPDEQYTNVMWLAHPHVEGGRWTYHTCGPGLLFNKAANICDLPRNYDPGDQATIKVFDDPSMDGTEVGDGTKVVNVSGPAPPDTDAVPMYDNANERLIGTTVTEHVERPAGTGTHIGLLGTETVSVQRPLSEAEIAARIAGQTMVPDDRFANVYWYAVKRADTVVWESATCGPGFLFNKAENVCDLPHNYDPGDQATIEVFNDPTLDGQTLPSSD